MYKRQILYVTAYALSAAGPGAISAQAVTILFAVTLAVQMKVDPLLLATPAFLGAVGGTASPIALTGIIISDLFAAQNISVPNSQWILLFGITAVNFLCALVTYIWFKGYRLSPDDTITVSYTHLSRSFLPEESHPYYRAAA